MKHLISFLFLSIALILYPFNFLQAQKDINLEQIWLKGLFHYHAAVDFTWIPAQKDLYYELETEPNIIFSKSI